MKKLLMFATAMLVSLSLMGCNFNKDKGVTKNDTNTTPTEVVEETNDNKGADNGTTNDMNNGDESNLEVAQDAADLVADLDEVDSATVIVTNKNAYVAVVLNDVATNDNTNADTNANADEALTADLEDKIANKVREVNKDIKNVYVSLNPDFVERMTDYGTRINEGKPVAGFFEEFTESVRRVFPDAR